MAEASRDICSGGWREVRSVNWEVIPTELLPPGKLIILSASRIYACQKCWTIYRNEFDLDEHECVKASGAEEPPNLRVSSEECLDSE